MQVVKLGPSLAPAVANCAVKIQFVQAGICLNGKKVIFILDKSQRDFFFLANSKIEFIVHPFAVMHRTSDSEGNLTKSL